MTEEHDMNTREVAAHLGTDPATLRKFLRSGASTFEAVGSGARYNFTERDIPTLRRKFGEWMTTQEPTTKRNGAALDRPGRSKEIDLDRDREVWRGEDPDFIVPDINHPGTRRAIRNAEEAARSKLYKMIVAAGLR